MSKGWFVMSEQTNFFIEEYQKVPKLGEYDLLVAGGFIDFAENR